MNSRWRSRLVVSVAVACGLVLAAQPAPAAPSGPADTQERTAAPTKVWDPKTKLPEPKVLPGKGTTIAPGTSKLAPTQPKALPGLEKAKGSTLKPGSEARRVAPQDVKKVDAAEQEEPLYCEEYVSWGTSTGEDGSIGPFSNTSYLAQLSCNFYLDYAYGVSYVVDRTSGYDGEVGYVGTAFEFAPGYYGESYGAFQVQGDLYDGGRGVEIIFELYLQSPVIWGACGPLPNLRYLLCDGVGTNLLHIVLGTGAFGTGLGAPVIRYTALGDSFSAGTGASSYISDGTSCRRSTQTYSFRLAGGSLPLGDRGQRLPIDQPNLKACFGAQIPDMFNPQPGAEGRQLDAVNPNRTRLVTLTMGGNDLGFTPILKNCTLSTCTAPLINPADLQRTQVALTSMYNVIRGQMRQDGMLVVLSYPAFLPNPDDQGADPQPSLTRCPIVNARVDSAELRAIYQSGVQIRNMVRDAVAATGDPRVVFVDVLAAFRGHRICSDDEWANGVNLLDIPETFHPNDRGYLEMALQATVGAGIGL